MALVRNEFGIKGRVGNVVFCKLNGKSYMRSVPDRIDPNTPQQQEVRSRFRVAVRFYQKIKETPLKGILDLSADKICSSGYALFMKKNLTELVFILDRSGSMQGREGAPIGG